MVMSYFDIHTDSTEREAERIVDSIHHTFSNISNLQDIGFLDYAGKPTLISNLTNRVADINFFTFHSSINTIEVNQRFSSKLPSPESSLRLP